MRNNGKTLNKLKTMAEFISLFAIDIFSLVAIFYLAVVLRTHVLPEFYGGFPFAPTIRPFYLGMIFSTWIFFFFYEGFYTKRFAFWDEIKAHWRAAFFSTVGIFTIVSLGKLSDEVSRVVVLLMGVIALGVIPLVRMGSKKFLRAAGLLRRRLLIVGAGKTGKLITRALKNEPNYGYDIIGYLDDDPRKIGDTIEGVKIHKGVASAGRYVERCNITDVVITMPGAGGPKIARLVNDLQHKAERILLVPDVFGTAVVGTNLLHFFQEQTLALELKNNLDSTLNIVSKRCFDYLASLLLTLLLLVPMAAIALLIRLTSSGPAVYRQERVGKRGRLFMCYKFRTMYSDAEQRLGRILDEKPEAKQEWEQQRKLNNDPRITPIGNFLRITSLDELPQLFNVLKGDMSLVGPRPVTQEEIRDYYKERANLCFSVPPGITGLWQVSGRSNTNYDYRIALDSWYVRNWNLWLDIVILLKTVAVVIKMDGAR